MGADLDYSELKLTIKDYFTKQPYIDSSGLTTLDMPYEAIEVHSSMYEPKVSEISSSVITLPSLIGFPELRPLLQNVKEGNRIEIYNFQPDCGDPVFAGFIPPNGISEADGRLVITAFDTLAQLRWQHLRRMEYLSAPASQLYDRARSIWIDRINADFAEATPSADFTTSLSGTGPVLTWGQGFLKFVGGVNAQAIIYPTSLANAIIPKPGDSFLMECDATILIDFANPSVGALHLGLQYPTVAWTDTIRGTLLYEYAFSGNTPPFNQLQSASVALYSTSGRPQHGLWSSTAQTSFPMPQSHRFAALFSFNFDGTVSAFAYLDNIQTDYFVMPWTFDQTTYTPALTLQPEASFGYVNITAWRMRQLIPVLNRAGRFNPQTSDSVTYQPNNEENLQFLQLIAEKDNAEYRPIYRAWPATDELELDAVGTIGKYASRLLSYEQPPALPSEGSPQVSPGPVITDAASFLVSPPFRFEEGYNLEATPKILPRANTHSNDVIRVGSSSIDSQVFAEKWSVAETGRPQHSPSNAQFPYFEQITNDDRIVLQSLVQNLVGLELTRRIDSTPALEVAYVEELPWAFKWQVGDQVFTKTQSLRFNQETELRAQKIHYKAGSPVRIVTLGKTDWDPSMIRLISESMKISWLYEQAGAAPGIYFYPSTGNILSGLTSPVLSIPLDQYTTGSSLVYAAIHWFTDANVLNVQPLINGVAVLPPTTSPSSTDSGLVLCTGCFQRPGIYQLQFQNNDANTRNLTGAVLVLRIKG